MKCKTCGARLTANTLDRCPKCEPPSESRDFKRTGRALELLYFIVINTLIILGLLFLGLLFFRAWLPQLPFFNFDP